MTLPKFTATAASNISNTPIKNQIDKKNTFSTKGVFILKSTFVILLDMEIYIEYAWLENFLYDGVLLWLAFTAAKVKTRLWKILVSAGAGAGFALLFPYLRLPAAAGTAVKLAMGCLLCLLPFGRLRGKRKWGRYLLTTVLFFTLSFGFGGTLLAIYGPLSMGETATKEVPGWLVFIGFAVLTAAALQLVKILYARKSLHRCLYDCRVLAGEKYIRTEGFFDSGNLARKNGKPVCFVSPALLYDLWGGELLEEGGQVCDEMCISTLTGTKTIPLYDGKIEVETEEGTIFSEVYFAPSKNMIKREYTVLLNARILEETERKNAAD